jgi:hypothetical protein
MPGSSYNFEPIRVKFDHDEAVVDAGPRLIGTVQRLGLEGSTDEVVGVGYRPGRKPLTLVHTIVAGGNASMM